MLSELVGFDGHVCPKSRRVAACLFTACTLLLSPSPPFFALCRDCPARQSRFCSLAGWLPDREEGLSASQQLEVTTEASLSSWGCGSRASCRRDNGEDSDAQHRQANKPNSRQAFRYNTKASAAAALPEAEGKKTTATTKGGGKSLSQNHFVLQTIAVHLTLFFSLAAFTARVVKGPSG